MEEEIKKLRAVVNSPNIGEALKAKAQARIDMLEEKAGKSTPAPKPEPKAKKEKKAPVKKESPKKETLETKPKKKGETVMEYAKRTRKAGESWNNAVARASKEVKNGGKPVAKKIKKTVKKAKPVAKKIKRTKVKAKPVAKKIKKTSKKAKTPKVPRTIKRVKYLTGSTSKGIDKQVGAMPPGKRISKSKKTYYEYRANRADLNRTKKLEMGGEVGNGVEQFGKGGEVGFQNSNLYLYGFGRDTNGNTVVKVGFPNRRGFSIQTNGNLKFTHDKRGNSLSDLSESDINKIEKEVVEYVKEYGSKEQKSILKSYN